MGEQQSGVEIAHESEVDALLDYQSGCWDRGERPSVESCLDSRPGLRRDPDAVLDLICHEILLRARLGESPDVEEYVRRFPQFADQLRSHFEVHQALAAADPHDSPSGRQTTAVVPPQPRIAGYEVLGEIGQGAMGVVYKARRLGLNRLTALKMLRPSAVDPREAARFRAEAEALARLEHPNIVRIYEVGEHEGRPFFALEFLPGGSLEAKLGGAPQPPRLAAELTETLARAVHEAHRCSVIHRDLKPANVLLTASGTPKITDFGLAKRLGGDAAQTQTGEILGTPSYMAPEQARGDNDAVGPRTDVYALGAILYEVLSGRPPFRGETVWDTLEQVVHREPTPPRLLAPRAPRDLETICLKCLRKEPGRRYGSAAELADDLRRLQNGEPIRARPASALERVRKWVRRRPAAAGAVVGAVVLTVALAAAHYADLRAKLAEGERAGAVADVRGQLEGVRTQLNAGRWPEAESRLRDHIAPRLKQARNAFPADAELAALATEADQLRERVDRRLTDDARLQRFRALRKELDFCITPFSGLDEDARRRRVEGAAAEALGLFESSPDAACFSEMEQTEIREGCCEMLLAMTAVAPPGEWDAQAPALLGRAARLGVDTPLIDVERTRRSATAPLTRPFEWFLRGDELARDGRWYEAIDAFEKTLARQPDHAAAHYALAVCYLKAPARADVRTAHVLLAQEHLSACIEERPPLVWPFLQRALARGELKDFDGAEADFNAAERLLQAAPDATAQYALSVNRGVIRIRRDNPEGAVADLQRAVNLQPDEPAGYVDLAMALQKQRRLDEAVAQLDKAIARTPPAALASLYRNRAKLDQEREDGEAAVHDLDEAARRAPGGAAADRLLQARLLEMLGRHEDAIAAADASLAAQPDQAEAHRLRAEALLHLDRYAEAVAALGRCLDAEQKAGRAIDPAVCLARARAAAAAGDSRTAAEDYTRYLALRPDDGAALAARGWAYTALDAPTLALPDFEASIRLDPNNADAYNGRAYALVRTARAPQAVRDAEEALRRGPVQPHLLYNAARVFGRAAQAPEAAALDRPHCRSRALELLLQALQGLPAAERTAFWRRTVEPDAAFDAVRASDEFHRLAAACDPPQ
ncbi:MAG TPA: protein kinase [Gemmataceae bacterium]|nr:protein kinase [Gemmataceae bacterium]